MMILGDMIDRIYHSLYRKMIFRHGKRSMELDTGNLFMIFYFQTDDSAGISTSSSNRIFS